MASIQPDVAGVENLLAEVSLSSTSTQDLPLQPATSELPDEALPKDADVVPPHISHDPQRSAKRTDPFQFGSRKLEPEDNIFEFNAWDHVEADDTHKAYAEEQYAKQRESPVSDFDKSKL